MEREQIKFGRRVDAMSDDDKPPTMLGLFTAFLYGPEARSRARKAYEKALQDALRDSEPQSEEEKDEGAGKCWVN